jgi:hypothetical protein
MVNTASLIFQYAMLIAMLLFLILYLRIMLVGANGCRRLNNQPKPKRQVAWEYLVSYSFTNNVQDGEQRCGTGNFFTNIDITDGDDLVKLRSEIENTSPMLVEKVVILNIMAL